MNEALTEPEVNGSEQEDYTALVGDPNGTTESTVNDAVYETTPPSASPEELEQEARMEHFIAGLSEPENLGDQLNRIPVAGPDAAQETVEQSEPKKELAEDITASYQERFGITKEDLTGIEGFGELSRGQQRQVLENLAQLTVGRIQEEAADGHNEDLEEKRKDKKFLGKVWVGVKESFTKKFDIVEREKKLASEIQYGGIKEHKVALEAMVEGMKNFGPAIKEGENGELEVQFIETEGMSPELAKIAEVFNEQGSQFSKIPYEWSLDSASPEQQDAFAKAKETYELQRGVLLGHMKEAGGEEGEAQAISAMAHTESVIEMQRFIQTCPDAAEELSKIEDQNAWTAALKSVGTERGLYLAGGAIARTAIGVVAGFVAAPIVAATSAGIRGWRKAGETMRDHDIRARKGEADTSAEAKNMIDAARKPDAEEAVGYRGSVEKIDALMKKIQGEEDSSRDTGDLAASLRQRVAYTQQKISEGKMVFGDKNERIANQYALMRSLAEAEALLASQTATDEHGERVGIRLSKMLNKTDEEIGDARFRYKATQAIRAGAIGGAFAGLGALSADAVRWMNGSTGTIAERAFGDVDDVKDGISNAYDTVTDNARELGDHLSKDLTEVGADARHLFSLEGLTEIKEDMMKGLDAFGITLGTPDALAEGISVYTVQLGDNLSHIFAREIPDTTNVDIIATLKGLSSAQIEALGVKGGNIDIIQPGDRIDVAKMRELLTLHSGAAHVVHPVTLDVHVAPHLEVSSHSSVAPLHEDAPIVSTVQAEVPAAAHLPAATLASETPAPSLPHNEVAANISPTERPDTTIIEGNTPHMVQAVYRPDQAGVRGGMEQVQDHLHSERPPLSPLRMNEAAAADHTKMIAEKWKSIAEEGPTRNSHWGQVRNESAMDLQHSPVAHGAETSVETARSQMQGLMGKANAMGFHPGKGEAAGEYLDRIAKELGTPISDKQLLERSAGIWNVVRKNITIRGNLDPAPAEGFLTRKLLPGMESTPSGKEFLQVQNVLKHIRENTGVAPGHGEDVRSYAERAIRVQLAKTPSLHADMLMTQKQIIMPPVHINSGTVNELIPNSHVINPPHVSGGTAQEVAAAHANPPSSHPEIPPVPRVVETYHELALLPGHEQMRADLDGLFENGPLSSGWGSIKNLRADMAFDDGWLGKLSGVDTEAAVKLRAFLLQKGISPKTHPFLPGEKVEHYLDRVRDVHSTPGKSAAPLRLDQHAVPEKQASVIEQKTIGANAPVVKNVAGNIHIENGEVHGAVVDRSPLPHASIHQSTSGEGSAAVANVKGNVTIENTSKYGQMPETKLMHNANPAVEASVDQQLKPAIEAVRHTFGADADHPATEMIERLRASHSDRYRPFENFLKKGYTPKEGESLIDFYHRAAKADTLTMRVPVEDTMVNGKVPSIGEHVPQEQPHPQINQSQIKTEIKIDGKQVVVPPQHSNAAVTMEHGPTEDTMVINGKVMNKGSVSVTQTADKVEGSVVGVELK